MVVIRAAVSLAVALTVLIFGPHVLVDFAACVVRNTAVDVAWVRVVNAAISHRVTAWREMVCAGGECVEVGLVYIVIEAASEVIKLWLTQVLTDIFLDTGVL
jgi:hypothetical protein